MSNKAISVYAEALKRQEAGKAKQLKAHTKNVTRRRDNPRDKARDSSSDNPREVSRNLPTRDEIQEFSFLMRDELKVKAQAEVPHQWQKELEETARKLNVKKLELYRYIFGEFLGKVQRKETA